MSLIARPATAGLGFDCSTKLVQETAEGLWAAGYRTAGRYVRLPGNNAASDIDARELAMLTGLSFDVLLIQHVRESRPGSAGWPIWQFSGADDAAVAVAHAQLAGYPSGAHLFVDLEDISGTADATRAFAEAWAAVVRAAGYKAGVYVGFDVPLDADGLWLLHGVDSYWSDAAGRHVSNRGCAIHQGPETTVAGARIDSDVIKPDLIGETPFVCAAEDSANAA